MYGLNKTLGFKRGQDTKKALNIGLRAKIASWLDEMNIENHTINDDFTIDVDGGVYLEKKFIGNLPSFIKFGHIHGIFDCDDNNLTSLIGSPRITEDDFYCDDNNLTYLEGAPEIINGNFYCSRNHLTSMVGVPKSIGGSFYCEDNNLTSLEGAPEIIKRHFSCNDNSLISLKEAPVYVEGDFYCRHNKVKFTKEDVRKVSNVKGEIYV